MRKRGLGVRQFWRDLSVSRKLYVVVGVMGLLIMFELLALRFAMNTLSSVRAFVEGEGRWSKAQKSAVISLTQYAQTGRETYYQDYLRHLDVPLGDRQARLALAQKKLNFQAVREGFLRGGVHSDDIPGLVRLVRRFHRVPHLAAAIEKWEEGDRLMMELAEVGDEVRSAVQAERPWLELYRLLEGLQDLDVRLTVLENEFSDKLGEGSRWLESLLVKVLLLAVLLVEGTGLALTFSFSRNLSASLKELSEATVRVGQGIFSERIPVRSRDELGQLAGALNHMTSALEDNIGIRRQAEQASQSKSLFLANMSHEIRTPLGAILGFSELLRDPQIPREEHERAVEIIHRTATNLSGIINDILDLSKVEAGRIELERSSFALPDFLEEMRRVLEIRCADKPLSLVFKSSPDVPSHIVSDSLRLRQILMNLLINAIKFTEQGEVRLEVRVDRSWLEFRVSDTGIGIDPADIDRLFHAFSQADPSSARKYAGTGLGLVLSRRLARLLGGDVLLSESVVGEGSTFAARIPLERPSPSEVLSQEGGVVPRSSQALQGKRILVVEDAPDNQLLIEALLNRQGVRVTLASHGEEGLHAALAGEFDLVLMDVQMPVMDGYTAVRLLREAGYAKPVIALTAHAMKEDRDRCLAAGYSAYLTKPIKMAEFLQVLRQYC